MSISRNRLGPFLVSLYIILFSSSWSPFADNMGRDLSTNTNKPNILLFVLDQWRFDWDGMHPETPTGPLPLKMPFLEYVATKGTRFTQAYVPTPLCAPVRACLAAGKEYDEAGVLANHADSYPIDQTTFYQLLRDKGGYHTMTCGKDDLFKGDVKFPYYKGQHFRETMDLGFSDAFRVAGKNKVLKEGRHHDVYRDFLENTMVPLTQTIDSNAFDVYYHCTKQMDPSVCNNRSFTEDIYPDDFVQHKALELLERRNPTKPWFLQVNFPGPHAPLMATAKMAESVKSRVWPDPFDSQNSFGWKCPQQERPQDGHVPAFGGRCNYAAELEHMDMLMQEVVDYLEQTEELQKTLVCVTGDHGEMLGDHGWAGKKVPWQASISVPLLCFGPESKRQVYPDPVTTLDLVGLFLDVARVDPAPGMTTSKTLSSILWDRHDQNETLRDHVKSGLGNFRLVVKKIDGVSYKLICCRGDCVGKPSTTPPRTGEWHQLLYDVRNDPFDMSPLEGRTDIEEQILPLLPDGWCRPPSSNTNITTASS